METGWRKRAVLRKVADMLPDPAALGRRVFVAVDGVDGSGKTTFADALAGVLPCPAARVSIDGFHRVRAERYRRGPDSPEGFWLDSYDYGAFRRLAIDPLRPGGSGRCRTASHDLGSDVLIEGPELQVPGRAFVLVDGIFLHRPELAEIWDASLFLDVSFETSYRRMELRDGSDPDSEAAGNHRYVQGQRLYLSACDPRSAADIVIDNNDAEAPVLLRGVPAGQSGRRPD
ncbi:uridine kinase [Arthrobacter sp. zg-Y916]|uniref:uridine kinase n=1 Tax=Arthrobacter sp. zg-Y916 TaxID=2894190 RepID=UPI001E5DC314|nr:uridine kinase [Arthrobacter sp. zg-Y916]MCC9193692.1 uridine kinase [Arthrobacter sp. zg-Y916]